MSLLKIQFFVLIGTFDMAWCFTKVANVFFVNLDPKEKLFCTFFHLQMTENAVTLCNMQIWVLISMKLTLYDVSQK